MPFLWNGKIFTHSWDGSAKFPGFGNYRKMYRETYRKYTFFFISITFISIPRLRFGKKISIPFKHNAQPQIKCILKILYWYWCAAWEFLYKWHFFVGKLCNFEAKPTFINDLWKLAHLLRTFRHLPVSLYRGEQGIRKMQEFLWVYFRALLYLSIL